MKQKTDVRYLTELSLLTALVLIMAYTPLGYLKTPWGVEITFIVIPVAIGSILLGPSAGGFLGFVFGMTSFFQCFGTSVLGATLLGINPVGTFFCCVVNRVLVGIVPGLLYKLLRRYDRTRVAGIAVCCFLTPVLNTVLYILGNWLIFSDAWLSIAADSYGYTGTGGFGLLAFMLGMVAVNGIAEAAACLVLGTGICKALQRTVFRREVRSH